MVEEWRPVPGFSGQYEVSNLGRVRSLERRTWFTCRGRQVSRRVPAKLLTPTPLKSGHLAVSLCGWNACVHVLVLRAFVGDAPEGHECLHGDGDPAHNALGNLRWGTRRENVEDALRHGSFPIGEARTQAKLKASDILEMRRLFSEQNNSDLARRYGVDPATIRGIRQGKSWNHIQEAN